MYSELTTHPRNFLVIKFFIISSFLACHVQIWAQDTIPQEKKVSHTLFLTGNTGSSNDNSSISILREISEASRAEKSASLLLLGNFTGENNKSAIDNEFLNNNLLLPLKDFNGKIILVPGVNEWKKGKQEYIDDLESYLQDSNEKLEIWPDDGCPLEEEEEMNEDFVLITVDSQWYLEEWDDYPAMNRDCEIRTREQFFVEFKDDLKDNHGKTKIVAIHHPIMTNTRHGFFNKIGGFTAQSFQNEEHRIFRNRLETLARQFDDVIFVSANDRNLQFIMDNDLPQIISGAAANTQAAKTKEDSNFASNKNGYAKLLIYEDGSSQVLFYETGNRESVFSQAIERDRPSMEEISYPAREDFSPTTSASVYTTEETEKGGFYRWLWGEHYREIYSRKIEVPTLFLEDLPGDLKPIKEGGGQQSRSLRFINTNENEYTLRAVRKSALRYLQANAVKDHYVEEYLQNTVAQRYVQDFFTTQHPYAPFAVNDLAEALDIFHANPKLFYVPRQKGLGIHNDEYGDELYMFEEHVGDENRMFPDFGSPGDIISTTDVLIELRENEKASINEKSYIKARLFDMLIGDWDRHEDQWRWGEFEQENGDLLYEPIPRDRDMAFSKYDGPVISLLKAGFPLLRKMQSYEEDIQNIKWFNLSGYPLDQTIIKTSTYDEWQEQVEFLQQSLTNETIDKAFAQLPEDALDGSIEKIKNNLRGRRDNLDEIAREYYEYLTKFDVLTGTSKKDDFRIIRKADGITTVEITTEGTSHFRRDYNASGTKELWIYGLEGDDNFLLEGSGENPLRLKIIGGHGHDNYEVTEPRKAKVFDYETEESTFTGKVRKRLVDSYDINNYDPEKRKLRENKILPAVGYDPDMGLTLGVRNIFTTHGLVRNPFTTQHELGLNYFFATNGWEFVYRGEFAHIFYNWNLGVEARYTGPNFTQNYFGEGNNSIYDRNDVDRDFNRVRMQQMRIAPALIWKNQRGSRFEGKAMLESFETLFDGNRFIGQEFDAGDPIFDRQYYAGAQGAFNYINKSNPPYPTRGMEFNFIAGYKSNIDEYNNRFAYLEPYLSIDYPLHHSGAAVLATQLGGEVILGDQYEFYHAAGIGGNNNLRGYRNDRFIGKSAFFHSTDLRVAFTRFRTDFIPIMMGVTAGFDYGRVWSPEETSNVWHHNYGGSFWINGFNVLTGNFGLYHGKEGYRAVFMLGFKF